MSWVDQARRYVHAHEVATAAAAPSDAPPPDWLRARARALRDGLAREAALERAPPGALLALAAAAATAAFLARGSVAGTGGGGSPN